MAMVNEYERQRLENIKRNDEMLAALKVRSKLTDLSAATKRQSPPSKSYKRSPVKKVKTETPVVLRRSLRTRGVKPDAATANGLADDINYEKRVSKTTRSTSQPVMQKPAPEPVLLKMADAYTDDDGSERKLIETISGIVKKSHVSESGTGFTGSVKQECGSVNVESLQLKSENIARVVPGRIMNVSFYPTLDMQMVVVGNKYGNIGLWNVNSEKDDTGIYLFRPHPAPISGIVIDPSSISKMYSSCYDGFLRMMDVEKEVFDMVYSTEEGIFSMTLNPHDRGTLCISEGKGGLNMLDVRVGKSSLSTTLHEYRINTFDFNSTNDNIMATSSTDGTACIWDLRQLNAKKPKPLKTVNHKRAVHSAYFSPSGKFLATTSIDDKVGLLSGANYEDTSMIYHYNQTNRWISSFRGIWGWDDSSIFIGNMKRGVDIISVAGKRTVAMLESDLMSAIPCRFAAHPYNVGMLAGATSGGQVYIWTP